MPRKPAKAQTNQKGTMSEKKGSCLPTIALSCRRSRPVTVCNPMIGVPNAPYATGAVFAIKDKPDAASGVNPNPIRIAPVDRKSTRLNSSHDQISYAVFCLKKKKIEANVPPNHQTQQPISQPLAISRHILYDHSFSINELHANALYH